MPAEDDQTIKNTANEAERWLEELASSPAPKEKPATAPRSTPSSSTSLTSSPSSHLWPSRGLRLPIPLIVAGSLGFGALVAALTMHFLKGPEAPRTEGAEQKPPVSSLSDADRSVQQAPSRAMQEAPSRSSSPSSPQESAVPIPTPKSQQTNAQAENTTPRGAWGPAYAYKFGQLPGGDYPDSCAFSQTNARGEIVISKSQMDYWACRDEGGNPNDGFSVVWADGKRTKYVFRPGGEGSIVGTNGSVYSIGWQNAIRNGSNVIIISHQDGATSWIPGQVE